MTESEIEQTTIAEGDTVRQFLSSDAGLAVLERLRKSVYKAWCDALTTEEREIVHSRGRAITDLVAELKRTADAGENAAVMKTSREAKKEREEKAAKR